MTPDRDDALWQEVQAIEAVIRADAAAAYHREIARAAEAVAHHITTKIWPAHRRDELEQYRLPVAASEQAGGTSAAAEPQSPEPASPAGGRPE